MYKYYFRAMKNRGVEIFMKPLEETNSYDIHSMLELQGVYDHKIKRTLIEIHTIMKNLVASTTFSINHLLRTAYLVSQNINQNQLVLKTIREICVDTYVRCLNGNIKQNAILEIDRILEEYPRTSNEFLCSNLKTIEVLQSSNLSYIKLQCHILEQHKCLSNTSIEDLLLCYFGRSSSSDIAIRSQWLTTQLKCDNVAIKHFITQPPILNFDMLNFVNKLVDHIDIKDLPYDFRYLPPNYVDKKCFINATTHYAENKIHLILDHSLNGAFDKNVTAKKLNKKSK